jgi:hypothetical protein
MDDRGIPSGPPAPVEGTPYDFRRPRPIGTTRLDHALTGMERDGDGRWWAHLTDGGDSGAKVSLWAGEGYRWLQVFTGDPLEPRWRRTALAVEPMTCPPNAFVTGDDLLVLEPGESVTHAWGIQAWLRGRRFRGDYGFRGDFGAFQYPKVSVKPQSSAQMGRMRLMGRQGSMPVRHRRRMRRARPASCALSPERR